MIKNLEDRKKEIVVDVETTGLNCVLDEILQLSIIDTDGNVLFDSMFHPTHVKSWPEAEAVNHISPDMVKDSPTLKERIDEINMIMASAKMIIGYNVSFDLGFLRHGGVAIGFDVKTADAMKMFAPIYGEWNDYFEDYKWQKLTTAAGYYDYDWSEHDGDAHNSLADCHATLYVYNKVLDKEKKELDKFEPLKSIKLEHEKVKHRICEILSTSYDSSDPYQLETYEKEKEELYELLWDNGFIESDEYSDDPEKQWESCTGYEIVIYDYDFDHNEDLDWNKGKRYWQQGLDSVHYDWDDLLEE